MRLDMPVITILHDGKRARLMRDYCVRIAGYKPIVVPRGFVTDSVSAGPFQFLVPKFGPWFGAAVVHDWLYRTGIVARKDADDIFLALMTRAGVNPATRWVMYQAVRWFGGKFYKPVGVDVVMMQTQLSIERRMATPKEQ